MANETHGYLDMDAIVAEALKPADPRTPARIVPSDYPFTNSFLARVDSRDGGPILVIEDTDTVIGPSDYPGGHIEIMSSAQVAPLEAAGWTVVDSSAAYDNPDWQCPICSDHGGLTLYYHPSLPQHYVVRDKDGAMWMVPITTTGWAHKLPYRGHLPGLQEETHWYTTNVLLKAAGAPVR